ncbi:uncharacterized protein [Venturia canescens]|uniref:uncharacterized protein n=1 Tax=Venturia canescens TaxID=32260 RepID=UPI001C9CD31F|nr:uncharacterized protein LOC122417387 [Venturia canescens]
MSSQNYDRTDIKKFDKNIKNVPEVFGRVVVAVAASRENGKNPRTFNSRDIGGVIKSVYDWPVPDKRRDYMRKFVSKNSDSMNDFISSRKITSKRTENSEFKSFYDIGSAAVQYEKMKSAGYANGGREKNQSMEPSTSRDLFASNSTPRLAPSQSPEFRGFSNEETKNILKKRNSRK